jgi:hypothetical protein
MERVLEFFGLGPDEKPKKNGEGTSGRSRLTGMNRKRRDTQKQKGGRRKKSLRGGRTRRRRA